MRLAPFLILLAACNQASQTTSPPDLSTSQDAAVADAALTDAAPATDGPVGQPITAPAGTWTWVDFPQAVCRRRAWR